MAVVGIYRPPYKSHPPYEKAFDCMMSMKKRANVTTLLMGDLNIHAWLEAESEEYEGWPEREQLSELSDPRIPTCSTGTLADGVLLAPGEYLPDRIPPQEEGLGGDGGHPEVYPVIVSTGPVLVDHYSL